MLARIFGIHEFTGWHMIGVLALFFGTIIGVNLTLAYYATSSWSGLVVPNSYVASQQFNDLREERNRQATLGWTAEPSVGTDTFSLTLRDGSGGALNRAEVTVVLGRVTHEHDDLDLTLRPESGGRYVAPVRLSPGLWSADIAVKGSDGTLWTDRQRITVGE